MVLLTVMYPMQPNSKFDMDYYLNNHIPMVVDRWRPLGMRDAQIVKGLSGGDPNSPPVYQVMGIAEFDSLDALQNAFRVHGEEIFGDVPNYTDIDPVVQISETIG